MKKYLNQSWQLFCDSILFFHKGLKENLLKEYFKTYFFTVSSHLGKFHHHLVGMNIDHNEAFLALQKKVKGLHSLLPEPQKYTYSILILLDNGSPKFLQSCLTSGCMQTAPNFEILIGSKKPLTQEQEKVIQNIAHQYPGKIKCFDKLYAHNLLAQHAKGNFLFIMGQNDWIRPDLLYRYEQMLRSCPNPESTIISCAENQLNAKDRFIPGTTKQKKQLHFPYLFQSPLDLNGLLIPRTVWDASTGLLKNPAGAEAEDLFLGFDLAKANFVNIPFPLYSRRAYQSIAPREQSLSAFIRSLKEYSLNKDLDWTFEQGYEPNSVRAIPQNIPNHKIQIVIPFKDQKERTLRCIDCVLKQKGVTYQITAVDNSSEDLSIGTAIRNIGGEVLRVDEPFNYSRLNNLAVARNKEAQDCDLVLFLNNDVELDENALLEMTRWIDQPEIGMVGARLHYPNGQLQHGGIVLKKYELPEQLRWEHIEKFHSFNEMKETKKHAIVDAVTAACALIKKETFLKVGGFDEIWYPIAFSDTSLAIKLNKIGLKAFYTPYAFGIHYESITRKESLEDVEQSRWLHQLINQDFGVR